MMASFPALVANVSQRREPMQRIARDIVIAADVRVAQMRDKLNEIAQS
jgi:hypothetical protein